MSEIERDYDETVATTIVECKERCADCGKHAEPTSNDPHKVQDFGDGLLLCLYCAAIRGIASHTCCTTDEDYGDDLDEYEDIW